MRRELAWLVPAVLAGGLSAYTVNSASVAPAPRAIPQPLDRTETRTALPAHGSKEESHEEHLEREVAALSDQLQQTRETDAAVRDEASEREGENRVLVAAQQSNSGRIVLDPAGIATGVATIVLALIALATYRAEHRRKADDAAERAPAARPRRRQPFDREQRRFTR
jgi:hypothetical protein